jgi:hypothetical protein
MQKLWLYFSKVVDFSYVDPVSTFECRSFVPDRQTSFVLAAFPLATPWPHPNGCIFSRQEKIPHDETQIRTEFFRPLEARRYVRQDRGSYNSGKSRWPGTRARYPKREVIQPTERRFASYPVAVMTDSGYRQRGVCNPRHSLGNHHRDMSNFGHIAGRGRSTHPKDVTVQLYLVRTACCLISLFPSIILTTEKAIGR